MKIGLKLVLGFLSVVLVVVFVGYYSSNTSQKALQRSIEENALSLAVETLDKIDRNIYGRIEDFQSLSKNLSIVEIVSDSNQNFEKLNNIQDYITKKDQEWTSAAKGEITPFMLEIMNNKLSFELRETLNFYQHKYDYKLLGEVFITNKYGANVAQTGKTSDYRQDDEKWWQEGKRDGLFVNDIEYDESAGVYSTDIIIRIDDRKGNFIGMIKVVLNVAEVINIINKLEERMFRKGSKSVEYTLIKKEGELIYSTKGYKYEEGSDILNGHRLLKGKYGGKYIEKGSGGNFLAVYAESRGYRDYKGLGWMFLIKYNTEEIFAPANELRNEILIISLIATIFALLAGLSISRSIAKPIIKLKDTSVEIGKGNLDIKIEVKSKDEIGQLARSFNDMICKLRKSKKLEEKHTDSLEEKVEKRTEELAVAMKQAISANKSKSEFLSTMSHEIRTPMNAIIGLTHLLLNTELTKKQKDYLLKSQISSQSLLGIINDILDFSKIEAGKLDMDAVGFDLESVLDNLSSVLSIRAEEKGLDILFDISGDLPLYLVGDPLRLGQVLLNLASNATKFTETGEVVVKAERDHKSDQDDNDNVALRFSVKDTGIGLSQDQIRKLFQSFGQADSSITRKFGGTGLGLAISKRLVEMMGGKIWVESELGKGCNFIFTARFGLQKEKDKKHFLPPENLHGMNILVVDDSETSRHILKSYLESFSFKVSLAESGKEAISMLQNQEDPCRLILMDWKMPEMDGIQASKIIKEHPGISTKPSIILVTAYGKEDLLPKIKGADLDGFLVKPVNRSLLFDSISEVFGKTLMSEKSANLLPSLKSIALQKIEGAKILLVEDNKINQLVAKDLLEDVGFVVTIADDGKEAVKKVREDDFDAVLMDLEMPEMDGYEATRRILSEPLFKELPIIAMTAHAMAGLKEKCLDAGMVDYTSKPINPEGLFKTLTMWIKPVEREVPVSKTDSVNGEEKAAPAVADAGGVEKTVACLPGLNVAEGLTRVNGNIQRYRDYLAMFAANHKGEDGKLETKWREAGAGKASKGAHALKGAAGNLALPRVCKTAAALESAFKKEKPDESVIKAALNELSNALKEALDSIKAYVKQDESKETGEQHPIDATKANALLDELTVLINDGDAASLGIADKLMSILKGGNLIKESSALKKHLMEYDFDEAKGVIITIKEKIGAKEK